MDSKYLNKRRNAFIQTLDIVALSNGNAIADEEECPRPLEFTFSFEEDGPMIDTMVCFTFVDDSHFEASYVRVNIAQHGEIELYDDKPKYSMVDNDNDKNILLTCATWIKEFITADHCENKCYVYSDWDDEVFYPIK